MPKSRESKGSAQSVAAALEAGNFRWLFFATAHRVQYSSDKSEPDLQAIGLLPIGLPFYDAEDGASLLTRVGEMRKAVGLPLPQDAGIFQRN